MANLTQHERNFYERKTGSNAPLNDLKRIYWIERTGSSANFLSQLEKEWLIFEIGDAGGTPSQTRSTDQLWREMVSAKGFGSTNFVNQNKLTFFLNEA